MRETYREGLDSYRTERLSPSVRTRLNFRPLSRFSTRSWLWFIQTLIFASVWGFVVAAGGRALPFQMFSGLILQWSIWCAGGLTIMAVFRPDKRERLLFYLGAALGVSAFAWFTTIVRTPLAFYVVVFAPALAFTAWLSDYVAAQHVTWHAADPQVEEADAIKVRRWWFSRWKRPLAKRLCLSLLVPYVAGFILLATVPRWSGLAPANAGVAVVFISLFFVAWALLVLHTLLPRDVKLIAALQDVRSAVTHFIAYSPPNAGVPGTYQCPGTDRQVAPAGPFTRRTISTVAAIMGLTAALTASAYYFPFAIARDPEPWLVLWEDADLSVDVTLADVRSELGTDLSQTRPPRHVSRVQQLYYRDLPIANREHYARTVYADVYSAKLRSQLPRFGAFLTAAPENWLRLPFHDENWQDRPDGSISQSLGHFMRAVGTSLCLSTLMGSLVFLSVVTTVAGPHVIRLRRAMSHNKRRDWDVYAERVLASDDPVERNSIIIGTHSTADYPILLPTDILREHAHILGDSGSGKTALGLSPMISQIIRMSGRDARDAEKRQVEREEQLLKRPSRRDPDPVPASVVIIDLKGDMALFHGAKLEAERALGKGSFKWFTNELGRSSYLFNPLTQTHMEGLTRHQQAEVLLHSLGLEHGEGYGRSYFSRAARQVLVKILEREDCELRSFREIVPLTEDTMRKHLGVKKTEWDAAGELFGVIDALAGIDAINCISGDGTPQSVIDSGIDMVDVVRRPQVVYFYLPAAIQSASARELGKLAFHSLLTAAIYEERLSHKVRPVYLFVDEFQQIVSENLEIMLRQARSKGIATILANQTISDLHTATANLIPTVSANTRYKQVFSASDTEQQDMLIKASGETIDYVQGFSRTQMGMTARFTYSWNQLITPRINRNELISISDEPTDCLCHVTRSAGYAQFGGFPVPVTTQFHITEGEYKHRASLHWPRGSAATMERKPRIPKPPAPDISKPKVKSKPASKPEPKAAEPESAAPAAPPSEKSGMQLRFDEVLAQQKRERDATTPNDPESD